jgi:hypothetical protein
MTKPKTRNYSADATNHTSQLQSQTSKRGLESLSLQGGIYNTREGRSEIMTKITA